VIPARNERGNIEPAVQRLPQFCDDIEIIFIEGHSKDGTFEEMERVKAAYPDKDIKLMRQPGRARRTQCSRLTMWRAAMFDDPRCRSHHATRAIAEVLAGDHVGKGEFINGSRLVYPLEEDAMRFLNLIANKTSICSRGC
jgi:glycosyltransferase involved in cell wall biosynthesis